MALSSDSTLIPMFNSQTNLEFQIVADKLKLLILQLSQTMGRPSVLMRPRLMKDGNKWCALYGEDLQVGLAGFGATPEEAMQDFDRAWVESLF